MQEMKGSSLDETFSNISKGGAEMIGGGGERKKRANCSSPEQEKQKDDLRKEKRAQAERIRYSKFQVDINAMRREAHGREKAALDSAKLDVSVFSFFQPPILISCKGGRCFKIGRIAFRRRCNPYL